MSGVTSSGLLSFKTRIKINKARILVNQASEMLDSFDSCPVDLAYELEYLHSSYKNLENKVSQLIDNS